MENKEISSMYQTYLLHSRADRALRVAVAKELDQYGLTMMEWLLLATVCTGPKEGMTMTEVAQALDVTLPQVTALMTRLVKIKMVKQKVASHDRRSRRLQCTRSGRKAIDEVEASVKKMMDQLFHDIPEQQLAVYMATVNRIANLEVPPQQ